MHPGRPSGMINPTGGCGIRGDHPVILAVSLSRNAGCRISLWFLALGVSLSWYVNFIPPCTGMGRIACAAEFLLSLSRGTAAPAFSERQHNVCLKFFSSVLPGCWYVSKITLAFLQLLRPRNYLAYCSQSDGVSAHGMRIFAKYVIISAGVFPLVIAKQCNQRAARRLGVTILFIGCSALYFRVRQKCCETLLYCFCFVHTKD